MSTSGWNSGALRTFNGSRGWIFSVSSKLLRSGGVEGAHEHTCVEVIGAATWHREIYTYFAVYVWFQTRTPLRDNWSYASWEARPSQRRGAVRYKESLDKACFADFDSIWLLRTWERKREEPPSQPRRDPRRQKAVDVDEAMDNAVRATKNSTALARKRGPGPESEPSRGDLEGSRGPERSETWKAEQKRPNWRVGDSWGIGDPTASNRS